MTHITCKQYFFPIVQQVNKIIRFLKLPVPGAKIMCKSSVISTPFALIAQTKRFWPRGTLSDGPPKLV
eukprot:SAG11_NODE_7233_length_1174_cov_2.196279_1_plen_68_part_00